MASKNLNENLINESELPTLTPKMSRMASIVAGIEWHDFEYKEVGSEPKVALSTLSLIVLVPALVVLQLRAAALFAIPALQYVYFAFLVAFLVNYLAVVRNYELMPYLPSAANDRRLKAVCAVFYAAVVLSVFVGWNGSGGILFAVGWEALRGSRLGSYKFFFLSVVAGSVLLEHNYSASKLLEFVPGLLFGLVNTELARLKASNPYAVTHQLVFFCAMLLPVFFAAAQFVVPSPGQWAVMLLGGLAMCFTAVCAVRLMQSGQASVVTAVASGIVMAGTATYASSLDVVGLLLVAGGVGMLIKEEYCQTEF